MCGARSSTPDRVRARTDAEPPPFAAVYSAPPTRLTPAARPPTTGLTSVLGSTSDSRCAAAVTAGDVAVAASVLLTSAMAAASCEASGSARGTRCVARCRRGARPAGATPGSVRPTEMPTDDMFPASVSLRAPQRTARHAQTAKRLRSHTLAARARTSGCRSAMYPQSVQTRAKRGAGLTSAPARAVLRALAGTHAASLAAERSPPPKNPRDDYQHSSPRIRHPWEPVKVPQQLARLVLLVPRTSVAATFGHRSWRPLAAVACRVAHPPTCKHCLGDPVQISQAQTVVSCISTIRPAW